MYTFVIGLIIFFAVLLVIVILAQNAKGGGLSSQFGGSGATSIIGVKKTGDLLEKLTWGFLVTIIALVLSTNFIVPSRSGTNEILEKAGQQQTAPQAPDLNLDPNAGGTPTDTTQK